MQKHFTSGQIVIEKVNILEGKLEIWLQHQTQGYRSCARSSATLSERKCHHLDLLLRYADRHRHVIHAANRPIPLDEKQVNAVAARIELDLRIGSSFTRMQTLTLKSMIEHLQEIKAISYGS